MGNTRLDIFFDDDDIKRYLPQYLNDEQQEKLISQISRYPEVQQTLYSTNPETKEYLLQGDIVQSVKFFDNNTGRSKNVKALINY